jgi:Icc-related predicted phosphoesterase
MRLLVMSDLHFEFHRDGGESFCASYRDFDDYDVAVVAGDLCDSKSIDASVSWLGKTFKRTVLVMGNHEAYGASVGEAESALRRACRRPLPDARGEVTLLEQESFSEDRSGQGGVRLVGSTLWFPHDEAGRRLEWTMNDFEQIRGLGEEVDRRHRVTKEWLWETLTNRDVLVTHHLPSVHSVHPKHAGSNLNRFFVGDIEELIRRRQPRLVIHGHTHENCDYFIGETRVVCNPFGYRTHALNPRFREHFVIEV